MYKAFDETYEGYSTHGLMNLAETFRANLEAANTAHSSYGQLGSRSARSASRTVASASGVTVRLDFSSQAVADIVLADLYDTASVIDEGWRRIPDDQKYASRLEKILGDLERQSMRFLDRRFGTNFRSVDDFKRLPAAIARNFGPA